MDMEIDIQARKALAFALYHASITHYPFMSKMPMGFCLSPEAALKVVMDYLEANTLVRAKP
jgi:hypothetical protein